MTRVAVTGATGFVGRALTAHLIALGYDVRALVRRSGAEPAGAWIHPIGDLGEQPDLHAAVSGVDAVVHLAARVHVMAERGRAADVEAAYRQTNVEGTVALARASAAAGVRRFVFVSSIKVNGESSDGRPFTSGDPPVPSDPYGRSKAEAEAALRRVGKETGVDVAIVRPPLVYGPGVGANFLSLLRLCDSAVPLPFAGADNRRSLVYVGNLTDALARLVSFPGKAAGIWIVTDGEDLSIEDLVRRLRHHLGRPARLFRAPRGLFQSLASLAGRRAALDRLYGSLEADSRPFGAAFGWTAPVDVDAGLAATVAWYRGR